MKYLPELFAANARWAEDMRATDPEFFTGLAALQSPAYLWIGCSVRELHELGEPAPPRVVSLRGRRRRPATRGRTWRSD
jgi:hypothetical protein